MLHTDLPTRVVRVEHAQRHRGQDHGEVEEERGRGGLAQGVLADETVLEVVEVIGEAAGEVALDAATELVPLDVVLKGNYLFFRPKF